MSACLVTGGAGFIGSHVVAYLLDQGHRVVVLDDLSGGFRENVDARARLVDGSILDAELVEELFDLHKFDYVYHLAAYAAEGLSHFIRNFNYSNNLIGSVNLINASIKHHVRKFIFTSSAAVYGHTNAPAREQDRPCPIDPYGIGKYAVEMDLEAAHKIFGLDYIIIRPHNVYGERQNIGDPYRNVIGIFMNKILKGDPLPIFGDGTQTRAFSYIEEVAPRIAQAASYDGGYRIFNIGSDRAISIKELACKVSEAMNTECRVEHLLARTEANHVNLTHDRQILLGAIKTISLEEGLSRMAAWAKERGPQEPKAFGNIEITENLPTSWKSKT